MFSISIWIKRALFFLRHCTVYNFQKLINLWSCFGLLRRMKIIPALQRLNSRCSYCNLFQKTKFRALYKHHQVRPSFPTDAACIPRPSWNIIKIFDIEKHASREIMRLFSWRAMSMDWTKRWNRSYVCFMKEDCDVLRQCVRCGLGYWLYPRCRHFFIEDRRQHILDLDNGFLSNVCNFADMLLLISSCTYHFLFF